MPSSSPGAGGSDSPICILPSCPDPKKKGARFCYHHNRHWESMKAQAKAKGEEQLQNFNEKTREDTVAAREVEIYAANNVSTDKGKRKSLINWQEWNERHGVKLSNTDTNRTRPYEKEQFVLLMINSFGRTRPEAEEIWSDHEASSADRDWKGYKGQVRLWILAEEFKDRTRETFIEGAAVSGSERKKNVSLAEQDAMRRHVHEFATGPAGASLTHEFFSGRSTLQQRASGSGQTTKNEEGDDNEDSADKGVGQRAQPVKVVELSDSEDENEKPDAKKKKRKVNVVDAKTTLFTKCSASFKTLCALLSSARAMCCWYLVDRGFLFRSVYLWGHGQRHPQGPKASPKIRSLLGVRKCSLC